MELQKRQHDLRDQVCRYLCGGYYVHMLNWSSNKLPLEIIIMQMHPYLCSEIVTRSGVLHKMNDSTEMSEILKNGCTSEDKKHGCSSKLFN